MKIKLNTSRQQGFFFVFGPLWFVALVMGAKALADHSQRQQQTQEPEIDVESMAKEFEERRWQEKAKADLAEYNRQMKVQKIEVSRFESKLKAFKNRPVWDSNGTYST